MNPAGTRLQLWKAHEAIKKKGHKSFNSAAGPPFQCARPISWLTTYGNAALRLHLAADDLGQDGTY